MRNVVFLHKRTLYFAVASRTGCVDLSIVRCVNGVWVIGRIPHGMRGFKHCYLINIDIRIKVAPRKGCVDLSYKQCIAYDVSICRIPQGMRGFKRIIFRISHTRTRVASRDGCVDLSFFVVAICAFV